MLLKIYILSCVAAFAFADNSLDSAPESPIVPIETHVEHSVSVSFETSHKRPDAIDDDAFHTSHKIALPNIPHVADSDLMDLKTIHGSMNLLPTKERPELNPVLSALINEDVMKSIEAKRAIEKEELEMMKVEAEPRAAEEQQISKDASLQSSDEIAEKVTEASNVLTTVAPVKKANLDDDDDDINIGFVDQTINLDAAGSENNKKSRIEVKKGPNGQEYEYEYVYYYEDEDEDPKAKPVVEEKPQAAGKSRYTNIERSTTATPPENALLSGKAKGRSSSVAGGNAEGIEVERLPTNTRFPSRGKNIDVQPTPALDALENAAEKKKISVKRPSLELVDSQTFNTDEKQAKGARNGDTAISAIEQEQADAAAAAAVAAAAAKAASKSEEGKKTASVALSGVNEETATEKNADDSEQTTPSMEKAALDLYAILANENFNMDMTTDSDVAGTTMLPDTTNADGDDGLTTLLDSASSSSSSTTTTTTTEATTTTTTTTTTPASIYGGRRGGLNSFGRNRFKLKHGSSTPGTEADAPSEPTKSPKNRFSRPPIGGRGRSSSRTTAAPATAEEEEAVSVKDVKPVNSAFGRNRPRNRFNLRGATSTETPTGESGEAVQDESVSSTTARTPRTRPTYNLRGRSRTTSTKPPAAADDESPTDAEAANDEKPAAPTQASPVRPSRFSLNRSAGNRLLPRTKIGRTADDATVDSSLHNDVKGEGENDTKTEDAEATPAPTAAAGGGLNRLKSRSRLNSLQQKTENTKPKVAAAPAAPRKVNPLLGKRRLHLGHPTTEAATADEDSSAASDDAEGKEPTALAADDSESGSHETTEATETATKPARGLGLLAQKRRLGLLKTGKVV